MNRQERLIERWENVLRVLRALTPHQRKKHWNMGTLGRETECGTVACALGHCSFDKWFTRRGISQETVGNYGMMVNFFGLDGVYGIFWNLNHRPVGRVIKEVRAHIKNLKADL